MTYILQFENQKDLEKILNTYNSRQHVSYKSFMKSGINRYLKRKKKTIRESLWENGEYIFPLKIKAIIDGIEIDVQKEFKFKEIRGLNKKDSSGEESK